MPDTPKPSAPLSRAEEALAELRAAIEALGELGADAALLHLRHECMRHAAIAEQARPMQPIR